MDDVADRTLIGHLALNPFGHEFQLVLDVLLEIAVGRTARHRPDRAHAAVGFVGATLIEKGFARRFLGPGEQRADHHGRGPRRERLGDIARRADAAVGDHRHAHFRGCGRRREDRRELRHSDPGDDSGGADRARADPDLDPVGTRIGKRFGGVGGGDVTGDDLDRAGQGLDPFDRARDLDIMAVGGVDDDTVDPGVDQRLAARKARIADGGRGGDPQAPFAILGGQRRGDRFLDILDGDQPDAMPVLVDHQQFLDPALMEDPAGIFLAGADRHRREIVVGHQFAHRLERIFGEADIAVCQDPDQLPCRFDDRDSADAIGLHQLERFGQSLVGSHRDRVDDHPAFEPFDRPHRRRLLVESQIAVENADPAKLGKRDRHVDFGDRVHRRGQQGNVERNLAGEETAGFGLAGQNRRCERKQQHVVEREPQRDVGSVEEFGHARPCQ